MKPTVAVFALVLCASELPGQARIEDNSFLIEEAYNQERGVVQHINAFERAEGGEWIYAFTQEWPLFGQRNQLSYTIPFLSLDDDTGGNRTRIGDVALNYRYQVLGVGGGRVAMSPRLSVLVPTGDEKSGHGVGGARLQANLPVSVLVASRLVTHYNAGFTTTPTARNSFGAEASALGYHVGASAIYLATPTLNFMLEGVWASREEVVGEDATTRFEEAFINPGFRFAINTSGGLQIVPGVAYTIGVGPSEGENGLFLYLSLEHAFNQAGR
jgi:hypothetical protein